MDSWIVRSGMELQTMGALHKVAIAGSRKRVSEGLGGSAACGAASDVALPLRGW